MEESEAVRELISAGERLDRLGFVPGAAGNLSARIRGNTVLATPSGINKGNLAEEDLVWVNLSGEILSESPLRPSSEIRMHLEVYRERPDVFACIHAHPLYCTAFAASGLDLKGPLLPEVIVSLGEVPLVEYGTPSTTELPEALRKYLRNHDNFLLANHGALSLGETMRKALHRIETLEFYAKVSFLARMLGGEKLLTDRDVTKLFALRELMEGH
ncbi:MAG: class II aldolase/adducin family protein [Armatimonadetes bacterium]|nr:class II aldolase/adducin family protein [Armatimonadota bacterium]